MLSYVDFLFQLCDLVRFMVENCSTHRRHPCGFTDDWDNPVALYDMDVMIAVRNFVSKYSRENINDTG